MPPPTPHNQHGFVLITVIILAAVLLSLIGLLARSSLILTALSGSSASTRQALGAADAGIEYVRSSFVLIGNQFQPSQPEGNFTAPTRTALDGQLAKRIVFVNMTALGPDDSLLVGSGFSGKYLPAGNGGLKLTPQRSRTTATGASGSFRRTIIFEGFNLSP